MDKLATFIKKKIKASSGSDKVSGRSRLLGRDFETLGVSISNLRKLIPQALADFKVKKDTDYLSSAEELLSSPVYEYKIAGILLLSEAAHKNKDLDPSIFKEIIDSHLDEWSLSDTFSTDVLAPYFINHWPQKQFLIDWSNSGNPWLRRSAVVTTIKCKGKVPNWSTFSSKLLGSLEGEEERIVKKSIRWLQRKM